MLGTVLLREPPEFKTFELAHRVVDGEHRFEVSYGSSFSELYYDFSPKEFLSSADREELSLQLNRVRLGWLVPLLAQMASGCVSPTTQDLERMVREGRDAG
jgi:hypothetical protein